MTTSSGRTWPTAATHAFEQREGRRAVPCTRAATRRSLPVGGRSARSESTSLSCAASVPSPNRCEPRTSCSVVRRPAAAATASCADEAPESAPAAQQASALHQAQVKLGIGLQMYQTGRFNEALGLFDQVLALDPSNHEAQFNRASAMAQLGRNDEALREFDRLLTERPTDPAILSNRGITLNQLGRAEEALVNIDQALAASPDTPAWLLARSQILVNLARGDEALQATERAKAIAPTMTQCDMQRAAVLQSLGRMVEAQQVYDALRAQYPNDAALKQAIDKACEQR